MVLWMAAAALPAGTPEGFGHWKSAELHGFEKKPVAQDERAKEWPRRRWALTGTTAF